MKLPRPSMSSHFCLILPTTSGQNVLCMYIRVTYILHAMLFCFEAAYCLKDTFNRTYTTALTPNPLALHLQINKCALA